ncbi:hypothetical protein H4R19_002368 [Coemansia spiralis]|nr:hypothetical protein H4R19_002368 [Coemansia spiralis]
MSQLPSLRALLGMGWAKRETSPSEGASLHGSGTPDAASSAATPQPAALAPPRPVHHRPPPPARPTSHAQPAAPVPIPAPHILHASDTRPRRDLPVQPASDHRYWPYARTAVPSVHSAAPAMPQHLAGPELAFDPALLPYMLGGDPQMGSAAWHRQRRTRACQNCHVKKVKCEGDGVRCFNCLRANLECTWVPMKKRGPKPKPKPETPTESADAPPAPAPPPRPGDTPSVAQSSGTPVTPVHGNTTPSAPSTLFPHGGPSFATALPRRYSRSASIATSASSPMNTDGAAIQPIPEPAPAHPVRDAFSGTFGPVSAAEPFNHVVRGSEMASTAPDSIDDVLSRFYSDEVPEETRNTVVYYFGYFYAICPIFHPASFIRRVVANDVDPILIDSMRASAARMINKYTDTSVDLDPLIEEIEQRLLGYMGEPNLDYVRAVTIMASLNGGECRFMMYNALACLAVSLVTRLGWHMLDAQPVRTDVAWDDWVNLEIKRRTFYIVFMIDGYLSLVSDRSMTLPSARIMTRPPGSAASWDDMAVQRLDDQLPTFFNARQPAADLIKSAALVYSCFELASLSAIMARINDFLWRAKIALSTYAHGDDFKPSIKYLKGYAPTLSQIQLPIHSLFAFDEFRQLHEDLMEWRRRLLDTGNLQAWASPDLHLSRFGSRQHRLQLMRARYFCLHTYSTPVLHCMHLTNRPSYFETQLRNRVFAEVPGAAAALAQTDVPENKFIYEILSSVFADRLNLGLLAYDVAEDSWRICVESVYELVRLLDRHRDIPLERYDQVMPFCLLTSLTVLIRNARMCRRKIEDANGAVSEALDTVRQDLTQSTVAMRRLWAVLGDLNDVWRISGIEYLLRMMQIEEVVNAADLFSGLSL